MKARFWLLAILIAWTVMWSLNAAFAKHQTAPSVPQWYWDGKDKPYPTMKENAYFLIGTSFPVEASYLLRRNGKIDFGKTIRITYTIENLADAPDWQATECTGSAVNTGTIGIMVRRSTDATKEYHRFWSTYRVNLEPGTYTLVANTAETDKWISVYGKQASTTLSKFKDLLANVRDIGMTFGGCGHYGHGVKVKNGNARFTIVSVTIQ